MRIEKRKKEITEKTVKMETVITLSKDEVKNIIEEYLKTKGYELKTVSFSVTSKYVEDSWGMNRHLISYFDHVEIIVEDEDMKQSEEE